MESKRERLVKLYDQLYELFHECREEGIDLTDVLRIWVDHE